MPTLPIDLLTEIENNEDILCHRVNDPEKSSKILKIDKNCSNLIILTCNIRSIRRNHDQLLIFISQLDVAVDVLVLTECWSIEDIKPPDINGYNCFYTKNNLNQNDGIIVYTKENFSPSVYEPDFAEGNCLIVNIDNEHSIVCTYRPPSFHNTMPYLNSLNTVLASLKSKNIIFTGDVNINTMPCNACKSVSEYQLLMATHGLRQGIDRPTRLNTCIDHFMVKTNGRPETIVFDRLTDHSPILLCIHKTERCSSINKCRRVSTNFSGIKQCLDRNSWETLYELVS